MHYRSFGTGVNINPVRIEFSTLKLIFVIPPTLGTFSFFPCVLLLNILFLTKLLVKHRYVSSKESEPPGRCGFGYMVFENKMSQEFTDLRFPHIHGMAFAMKKYEPFYPFDVCFLAKEIIKI